MLRTCQKTMYAHKQETFLCFIWWQVYSMKQHVLSEKTTVDGVQATVKWTQKGKQSTDFYRNFIVLRLIPGNTKDFVCSGDLLENFFVFSSTTGESNTDFFSLIIKWALSGLFYSRARKKCSDSCDNSSRIGVSLKVWVAKRTFPNKL